MKKQNLALNRTSLALAIHNESHTITKLKLKPKVRVVHVITPEIIEIDAADFQNMVQRLTGKSAAEKNTKLKKPRLCGDKEERRSLWDEPEIKMLSGFLSSEHCRDTSQGRQEMMNSSENLSDGFLSGFEDLDKFINELLDFSLFP